MGDSDTEDSVKAQILGFSLAATLGLLFVTLTAQQPITAGVPSGAIFYFNAACPTGYAEFTSARGNVIVGLVSGGTLNTQVGTALTDQENRPTGVHTHTTVNHGHGIHGSASQSGGGHTGINDGGGTTFFAVADQANVTVNNSAGVAGTNAPYIQLRVCKKN